MYVSAFRQQANAPLVTFYNVASSMYLLDAMYVAAYQESKLC